MGSYDGAEVCELVGLYILNKISTTVDKCNVGLYRDDGLAVIHGATPAQNERTKKQLCKVFADEFNLKITADANLKTINFLDITLDLANDTFKPYRKPGDSTKYINVESNHPSSIIKEVPKSISKRISTLSNSEDTFEQAIPSYQKALSESGFDYECAYQKQNNNQKAKKCRKRNILSWYNPPYSMNIATNIGKEFFRILDHHFPQASSLHKIFNRNTVKLSYSCTTNFSAIISSHNKKIMNTDKTDAECRTCNCPKKSKPNCPLEGKCLSRNIVYKATVTSDTDSTMQYIGLSSTTFKERLGNHTHSFKTKAKSNATELSKYIWTLNCQRKGRKLQY